MQKVTKKSNAGGNGTDARFYQSSSSFLDICLVCGVVVLMIICCYAPVFALGYPETNKAPQVQISDNEDSKIISGGRDVSYSIHNTYNVSFTGIALIVGCVCVLVGFIFVRHNSTSNSNSAENEVASQSSEDDDQSDDEESTRFSLDNVDDTNCSQFIERFKQRDWHSLMCSGDIMPELVKMFEFKFVKSLLNIYDVCFSTNILLKSADYLPSSICDRMVKQSKPTDEIAVQEKFRKYGFVNLIGILGSTPMFIARKLATFSNSLYVDFSSFTGNEEILLKTFLFSNLFPDLDDVSSTAALKWLQKHQENFLIIINNFEIKTSHLADDDLTVCDYGTPLLVEKLVIHLCKKNFFPDATVLLITFPHTAVNFYDIVHPDAIFLQKIPPQNIESIVDKIAGNTAALLWREACAKYLWLSDICSCPLLLFLFLKTEISEGKISENFFTFTQLFEDYFDHLYVNDCKCSKDHILIQQLAKLAHEAIANASLKIATNQLQNVHDLHFKLDTTAIKLMQKLGSSVYFCHQAFQEYFSMIYVVHGMNLEDFQSFVCSELFTSEWVIVRKFLCSYLMDIHRTNDEFNEKRSVLKLEFYGRIAFFETLDRRNLIELCLGVQECNNEDFTKEIVERFPSTIDIKTPLSMSDIRAFAYVLTRVGKELEKICLIRCDINSDTLPPLCAAIKEMPGCLKELDISENLLESRSVEVICEVIPKVTYLLWMHDCFVKDGEHRRDASIKERSILQRALNKCRRSSVGIEVEGLWKENCFYAQVFLKQEVVGPDF